jgi:hypothetical protein
MKTKKPVIILIPLITALVTMPLLFLAIFNGWLGEPAGHGTNFCEVSDGMIKQPVNTWSNLGYLLAGLVVAWSQYNGRFQHQNNFNNSIFFGVSFATMAVLICPGSMAMHATTSKVGGFMDMFSMFLFASYMAAYAMMRTFKWGVKGFLAAFFPSLAYCVIFWFQDFETPFLRNPGTFAFASLLLLSGIFEHINVFILKMRIKVVYGIAAMATMGIAFIIWRNSITGSPYCDPSSIVQGHGIWHLLTALAVYWLYRYYVSEEQIVGK